MNHAERRREQRKGFSRSWDRHHSVPKSRRSDVSDYDVYAKSNIVIVAANAHRNFHAFAANLLPHELAQVLNGGWIDPRAEMVAVWRGKATEEWKRSNGGILYR